MTTGSGDSRTFGGGPLFGDPAPSSPPRSTVIPETSRGSSDGSSGGSTVVPPPSTPPPSTSLPSTSPSGAGSGAGSATQNRPLTVGTAPISRKKGRRARLTVKRIDPWTTLKFSFVYGLAGMVVLLVSVVVLYGVVDAMGVISSIRSFLGDVSDPNSGPGLAVWLGFGRVMLVAIVVGLINVVLFTAFATLTAFIYNVCTDIVGGVEVTLAERN